MRSLVQDQQGESKILSLEQEAVRQRITIAASAGLQSWAQSEARSPAIRGRDDGAREGAMVTKTVTVEKNKRPGFSPRHI